jgi:hypothetical protein
MPSKYRSWILLGIENTNKHYLLPKLKVKMSHYINSIGQSLLTQWHGRKMYVKKIARLRLNFEPFIKME